MVDGEEGEGGGRIIPALRYRNAKAAIDWLCKAFGFEKTMVVPGEGDSIAHAELRSRQRHGHAWRHGDRVWLSGRGAPQRTVRHAGTLCGRR